MKTIEKYFCIIVTILMLIFSIPVVLFIYLMPLFGAKIDFKSKGEELDYKERFVFAFGCSVFSAFMYLMVPLIIKEAVYSWLNFA